MRAVKPKNTKPEIIVRRVAYSLGYRYRLHRSDLPAKPDLTFPARRKIIFVNGCFWHGHACKRGARAPVTNAEYWKKKITRNRKRDNAAGIALKLAGWSVLVIWECETKDIAKLAARLRKFLGKTPVDNGRRLSLLMHRKQQPAR